MPFDQSKLFKALSKRMLKLRNSLGWSQQELADRSAVSRRMIGLIESGESNVSLATLGHIAAAFNLTFTQLITEGPKAPLAEGRPGKGLQLWQGSLPSTKVDLLHSLPAARTVELWKWTIAPGDRYQGEPDLSGYHEMVYVIRGELTLERESGSQVLKAGDSIAFPSNCSYAFVNHGKGNLSFILNVVA